MSSPFKTFKFLSSSSSPFPPPSPSSLSSFHFLSLSTSTSTGTLFSSSIIGLHKRIPFTILAFFFPSRVAQLDVFQDIPLVFWTVPLIPPPPPSTVVPYPSVFNLIFFWSHSLFLSPPTYPEAMVKGYKEREVEVKFYMQRDPTSKKEEERERDLGLHLFSLQIFWRLQLSKSQ